MISCIGRLDLATSTLEILNHTIGNIVYIDSAVFSKRRVFRGHDHTIRFEI